MGVVIEREEWALTPLAYPLLSAASLAAVLLLPYFSSRTSAHATGSSFPFDVGTAPFLRFRRAFLVLFSLASGEQLARPSDLLPLLCRRAAPNRVVLVVVVQWLKGSIPCSGRMSSCGVGLAGSRWPRALPIPLQLR